MSLPEVGFIGLGIMGNPMAGHILKAGYPLTVFNRTPGKDEGLVSAGARRADNPCAVAENSKLIVTMVSDSPDVEEVVAGPKGILEGIKAGSVVIDMSTISPAVARQMDRLLRERACDLIDAPVSGGDVGAKNATLAIMAGGLPEVIERVRPLLAVMGKTITHCGPVGTGQTTKLCNQVLVAVTLMGVCEALVFARKNGLDPQVMIEATKGGAAGSWQLSNLGPRIVARDFAPGFMIDLIQKDLRILTETAAVSGVSSPASALARQLFFAAQASGDGSCGTQALARVLESLNGLIEN